MSKNLYSTPVVTSGAPSSDGSDKNYRYQGFSTVGGGRNFKLRDVDLVKQNIINMFHISPGELINQPSAGCIAWQVLFEPQDDFTIQKIGDNIASILNADPRISVADLQIEKIMHGVRVSCTLTYIGMDMSESITMDFDYRNNTRA
jgi:phage baseplate assembly protein W